MSTIRPPAHVEPYVRLLGEDGAIAFLLEFGGSRRVLSARPRPDNPVVALVGREAFAALHAEFGIDIPRVPVAKEWIARVWLTDGATISEVARRLHVTDVTVRRWASAAPGSEARERAREERTARAAARAAERARQIDIEDWIGRPEGRKRV